MKKSSVINYKKLFKKFYFSKIIKFGLFLFLFFLFSQTASATIYAPGATLEPDCAPGSLNCGVSVPSITHIGNTNLTLTGARILSLNGNSLTLDGTVGDVVFGNDGSVSVGGNLSVTGNITGNMTGSAQNLTLAKIGSSTFSTLQDMQNVFHSAGWTSGGTITDAGGGNINVSAGTGLIRNSNTAVATISYFDWTAMNGIAIPSNSVRYVGVEYNGGSPQISVRTSANWNLKTDFPIGVVANEGGTLSIYSDKQAVGDHAATMIQREYETMPLSRDERDGGLIIGETGTRNITLTAGAVWDRLNRYIIPAFDTSITGNFDAYYRDGGSGFTKVTGLTQWPNTKYDNGSGTLATMTDNYYSTLWFFIDTNSKISMVYGRNEYTTSSLADAEMEPDTLPSKLMVFGKLLGKVVFQKSASSAVDVSTAFSMSGSSSLNTNHANLTGLDYASSGHTGFADAISGVNDNITSMTGVASIAPTASALNITGNGASLWKTISGALTLDSAAALNIGNTNATSLSLGKSGITTTNNGNLAVVGNLSTLKGTDYTTTGSQNNVNFGFGSLIRYTGVASATFTGITGGTDGRILRVANVSSSDIIFNNLDGSSSSANQVITTTGTSVTIAPNGMITLAYDSSDSKWRIVSNPVGIGTIAGFAFVQSGNAFGTTASLGTTDANALNLITSGATRFALSAGSATLTGTGATSLASTGALTLDAATALNVGTTNATSVSIGKTGVATAINSTAVNLAGNSTVLDMSGTGILGLNTTTNRPITTGTGMFTAGGDLTVTGNHLYMGTNTGGDILVADGSKFNPVAMNGDASISSLGAVTLNYAGAQASDATHKGFLTAADWVTFNSKQPALGFTAEDVANKSAVTTLGTSDTLYPTQKAVKTYVDNIATGLAWKQPVELINTIADVSSPPGSPVNLDGYIINTGGNTGVWASFAPGDLVQYQTPTWVKIKSLVIGDRFGVAFKTSTTPSGGMTGKTNYEVQVTGGTAGAYTYTFTAPTNNDALFVQNTNAFYHNVSFTYSSALTQWVQFSATVSLDFLSGLSQSGNDVSLGALTSDWNQTGVFNINTAGNIAVNGGSLSTTSATANLLNANATTLNIGGAATAINLGAAGAIVTGGGALTINSAPATAVTVDSGTTGAVNIGNSANAKTITLGNITGATALNINTGTGGSTYTTTNGTFNLNTGTGAINIGTDAGAKTITIGNTTGATALNLNSGSGGINLAGNTTITDGNSFTTGTGVTTLNSASVILSGNSTILDMTGTGTLGLNTTTNRAITTGTGLFTTGGGLTVTGALSAPGNFITAKGTDYTTTGTQNDVDFGTGSLFRYTGASTATFTGIAGGVDGRQIRIMNASSSNVVIKNDDAGSSATNRVLTTAGGDLTLSAGVSVGLQYDSGVSRWRVVVLPATSSTVSGFAFVQSGNAFGTTASLGTTDANALNFITGGATRFALSAGSATLTGTGTTSLASTGSLSLDSATGLSIGTTNATSLSIGRTGITTTNNGALTSTQTLTASNGLTLTTGALNLTATSGTIDISSATISAGSPLVFDGSTPDANKTTFVITDPTGARTITFPNASITVNAAASISGTTLASNVVTSSLTAVGALSSGSIASGFGSISTTNNITTSGNISTTGTGTLTSAGTLTASNAFTMTTGALSLTSTSGEFLLLVLLA